MRNLKKVLSLVLAMAMMLSVMVVGAGATYKTFGDQDEIVNDEAVFLLNALNIVEGRDTGDFEPGDNLSRAEAAKLVASLNLGGVPVPNANGKSSFVDVVNTPNVAWANDYIEYGVAQGSINGVGDDRFAPNSNVTGVQFAKMLLGILGYNAETEKFVGASWEYYVNTAAIDAGLYRGLDIEVTAPITRDDAAQMMFNALKAWTVIYLTDTTGALSFTRTSLMEDKYPTVWGGDAVMTAIEYDVDDAEYTYTFANGQELTTEVDYTEMLGMNVMYVVDRVEGVLGFYAYENGAVETGVWGDVDLTDDEFDGAEVVRFQPTCVSDVHSVDLTTAAAPSKNFCDYSEYKAVDNDNDGTFDYVIVTRVHYEIVEHVNADRVLTDGNSYDFDDNTIYAGVARDDVVEVTYDSTLKTMHVVEKIVAQSGVIDSVSANNGDIIEIVIGGKSYNYCNVNDCLYDRMDAAFMGPIHNWDGKKVDFYVINGYVVAMDEDVTMDRDYLLITSIGHGTNSDGTSVQADVMFGDGSTDTITIASLDVWTSELKGLGMIAEIEPYLEQTDIAPQVGYLARYEVVDGKYELISTYALDEMVKNDQADLGFDATAANYNADIHFVAAADNTEEAFILVNGEKVRIAEDAQVFLVDHSADDVAYSVVSGADIMNMTFPYTVVNYVGYEEASDNFPYATLIYIETVLEYMSGEQFGMIVSETVYTTINGDEYVYFDLFNGEKTFEVFVAVHSAFYGEPPVLEQGDLISYTVNDGKLYNVEVIGEEDGHVVAITALSDKGYADMKLSATGYRADEVPAYLTENTQVIIFNTEDAVAAEGELAISDWMNDEYGVAKYFTNAFVIMNGLDVELIVFDPAAEDVSTFF